MSLKRIGPVLGLLLAMPFATAAANVITDWDEKAVGIVQTKMGRLRPIASWR